MPVPGFEKDNVDPIPTPDIVPNPIDSTGLKYNSVLSFKSPFSNFDLALKINFLGF